MEITKIDAQKVSISETTTTEVTLDQLYSQQKNLQIQLERLENLYTTRKKEFTEQLDKINSAIDQAVTAGVMTAEQIKEATQPAPAPMPDILKIKPE